MGYALRNDLVCYSILTPRHSSRSYAGDLHLNCASLLAALCLLAPQLAHSQAMEAAVEQSVPAKQPVESELIYEGLASYGNYKIFASGTDCKLYTSGIEYDRHSWGSLLKGRMDYVAEVLPLVILDEPAKADIWGNPMSYSRQIVPGIGFSPIGFRLLWRDGRAWKPYLLAKGGLLVFDKKVISTQATYENFSLQSALGMQVRMTQRLDLRLGLFSDFHFSDGFIVPVNPGLDVMNANWGISYHLRK